MFKNKNKKPITMMLQKIRPIFITTDGEQHIGVISPYGKTYPTHSLADYRMIDITSREYIKDTDDVMYPLNNVLSIKWEIIDEIEVIDKYKYGYQRYFNNKEVAELKKV